MLAARPHYDLSTHHREIYYTDASDVGMGIVIFTLKAGAVVKTIVKARRWTVAEKALHINVKELLAVKWAIQGRTKVHATLFIDSTTAQSWVRRGYARNYLANTIASETAGFFDEVCYIKSASNIADFWSRHPHLAPWHK
jgi:hypothetical protein